MYFQLIFFLIFCPFVFSVLLLLSHFFILLFYSFSSVVVWLVLLVTGTNMHTDTDTDISPHKYVHIQFTTNTLYTCSYEDAFTYTKWHTFTYILTNMHALTYTHTYTHTHNKHVIIINNLSFTMQRTDGQC